MKENIFKTLSLVVVIILLVVAYIFYEYKNKDDYINLDLVEIETVSESNNWENNKEVVVDTSKLNDTFQFSFDGGYTWQDSNKYTVTENGVISIVLKDKNGNVTGSISYKVETIDSKGPTIKLTLPATVYLNETLDLKKYVQVTDDISGVNGEVNIEPETLDTSTVGEKRITFTSVDNAGNETSIVSSISVIKKSQNTQDSQNTQNTQNLPTTLYRYRTKTIVKYNCNAYNCDYLDNANTTALVTVNVDTGKCKNAGGNLNNGCFVPISANTMCTQALTPRIREYKGVMVDAIAISKGIDPDNIGSNNMADNYKKEPCGTDEIAIEGYCHNICSYDKKECPSTYTLDNNICKKNVSKTCYETCENTVWSEWSSWSTTVVVSSSTTQVEVKKK